MSKNIYIENHEEIKNTQYNGKPADVGVALDIFETNHDVPHDALARAEYKKRYAPDSLSWDDKKLLEG